MAVYSKPNTGSDVINGMATVMTGAGTPSNYDDATRTSHVPDPSGVSVIRALEPARGPQMCPPPAASGDAAIPGSGNVAAVVTYPAHPYGTHQIGGVAYGYNGTPVNGHLTVEDGSTKIFSEPITTTDGYFNFAEGLRGTGNKSMTVTLAAAGSSVKGEVTVKGHKVG